MSLYSDLYQLLDEGGGAVFFTTAQSYDALNAAQMEIEGRLWETSVSTYTLTLTASADLIQLATTSLMLPKYILDSAGKEVFGSDHERLEDWSAYWKSEVVGKPQWLLLWDWHTLRAWPRPDQSYEYKVVGVPWPTEISTTTQSYGGSPLISQAIVHLAAASLFELTQPGLSETHFAQSQEFEKRYARQKRNEGGGVTRVRPGTAWQVAKAGSIGLGRRYS